MTSVTWEPHPYQERLMSLMLRQAAAGALLDPGLGKTSCTLAIADILLKKEYIRRVLVISPLRPLYSVWPAEIAKWSNFNHLKYHIFHGTGKVVSHIPEDTQLILMNPEGLLWLLDPNHPQRLEGLGVDALVVDESTRFKDSSTQRFKKLRKVINQFKRRYILTGSITPNGITDLFGQIFILDRGNALGQFVTQYRRNFLHQPDAYNTFKWAASPEQFDRIIKRISPLVIQLQAEDYLTMPDLINSNVPIELPEDAREIYDRMENDFMIMLHEGATLVADNAAVVGGKCRQIANGRVYVKVEEESYIPLNGATFKKGRVIVPLHKEKVAALEDLIEELQGAPALVLYEYQHDRDAILEQWPDTPVLGGGVTPKQATEIIDRFNAGEIPMLIGHPASMGHGINLQEACHHVIWYGITWNFEHYDQAIRRVYRQGQQAHSVFVYHIMAKRTLDEKVLRVLQDKKRGQQDLLNALIDPL